MSDVLEKAGRPARLQPFDHSGIARGDDGVLHYTQLHGSLLAMVRATVEARRDAEAVVELGGPRLSYGELWDRAARIAGGLAELNVERGDRVAIRLANSADWALAFLGTVMAGALVVPVNTRFAKPEVEYVVADSGAAFVFEPGQPAPDGNRAEDDAEGDRPGDQRNRGFRPGQELAPAGVG